MVVYKLVKSTHSVPKEQGPKNHGPHQAFARTFKEQEATQFE